MNKSACKTYPHAYQAARSIHQKYCFAFPLNVSLLLENIESYRIYDVSSETYNTSFAKSEAEMLYPQKAWTLFNEQLDTYVIIWNGARDPASIRYSVAHEIGHILLNHERAWPTDRDLMKQDKEREADAFARYLLAPRETICTLFLNRPFSARLAAGYFGIPYSVAAKLQQDCTY